MTHISLTHLTLTLPDWGSDRLPGNVNSVSLTNLIRLEEESTRKTIIENWMEY